MIYNLAIIDQTESRNLRSAPYHQAQQATQVEIQHNAGHMQQDTGYSILQAICYALLLQLIRWVLHIILTK